MAIHSSILAWKILWTEEPGRLQSSGLQESDMIEHVPVHVRACTHTHTHTHTHTQSETIQKEHHESL